MKVMILKKRHLVLALGIMILSLAIAVVWAQPSQEAISTKAVEPSDGISVPIVMYHSVLKDPSKSGKYVVRPDELEADIVYLLDHGYTPVTMTELINYVYDDAPLPEKPVVLTFDDGHYNNYTYLFPLLEKYDIKAVVSIVGAYAQNYTDHPDPNPGYAYLSWNDIQSISQTGRIEFQNHSFNMHSQSQRTGCSIMQGEDETTYRQTLREDLEKNQQLLETYTGVAPNTFTYPFGAVCDPAKDEIQKMGFKASLSCYERPNTITKDPACLYDLHRYNRPSNLSTEQFMKKIGVLAN